MRTTTFNAFLILTLAGCGKDASVPVPAPTGSAVPQDDNTRIRGYWMATGVRRDDAKPEEIPNDYSLRFDIGNYTMQLAGFTESGQFTMQAGASPKQIDFTTNEGELRKAIYALDGDKLTICLHDVPGNPRPTEIKALSEENRISVVAFTRAK